MLRAWFGNASRVMLPGRAAYIWGRYANVANYPPALREAGLYFSQTIIWDKQHPVLTRKDFMGAHEWCQPPGTEVLTSSGSAPIESLRDGDRVVTYSRHNNLILGRRQGFEVRRGTRRYAGELFGVVVGAKTTWATDGHLWTARMTPEARERWCVYPQVRNMIQIHELLLRVEREYGMTPSARAHMTAEPSVADVPAFDHYFQPARLGG